MFGLFDNPKRFRDVKGIKAKIEWIIWMTGDKVIKLLNKTIWR